MPQGAEEGWIEVAYTRELGIEDRRAVGDGTAGLAERTTVLTAKTTVLAAKTTGRAGKATGHAARDVDG